MKIDVHTHIFPPEIVQDRDRFFHGEPAFELLYSSPKSKLVGAELLVEAMDEAGIDYSVVFGFPWSDPQTAARNNDYVLESAAKFPSRLIPLACVHPLSSGAEQEAARCLEAGAAGLGELAIYGDCDQAQTVEKFRSLASICLDHHGVLLVHANEPVGHAYPGKAPQPLRFYYELAKACHAVTLILAHWGGGLCFYELLKKEVRETLSHVYYDTAASPYLYRKTIFPEMVRILSPDKILLGSDYPLLPVSRYFKEMEEAGLDPTAVEAIAGANAAKVFGLKPS